VPPFLGACGGVEKKAGDLSAGPKLVRLFSSSDTCLFRGLGRVPAGASECLRRRMQMKNMIHPAAAQAMAAPPQAIPAIAPLLRAVEGEGVPVGVEDIFVCSIGVGGDDVSVFTEVADGLEDEEIEAEIEVVEAEELEKDVVVLTPCALTEACVESVDGIGSAIVAVMTE
jgi:hypothetical protein